MDLTSMNVFKVMTRKMDWLSQRQEVVAQNIANVDTPKYRPSDITPFTFRAVLEGAHHLPPVATNSAHMQMERPKDIPGTVRKERKPYETKPDGNSVVVEEQMLRLSQTSQDYNMVTNLYRTNIGLLKTAIGHGGS